MAEKFTNPLKTRLNEYRRRQIVVQTLVDLYKDQSAELSLQERVLALDFYYLYFDRKTIDLMESLPEGFLPEVNNIVLIFGNDCDDLGGHKIYSRNLSFDGVIASRLFIPAAMRGSNNNGITGMIPIELAVKNAAEGKFITDGLRDGSYRNHRNSPFRRRIPMKCLSTFGNEFNLNLIVKDVANLYASKTEPKFIDLVRRFGELTKMAFDINRKIEKQTLELSGILKGFVTYEDMVKNWPEMKRYATMFAPDPEPIKTNSRPKVQLPALNYADLNQRFGLPPKEPVIKVVKTQGDIVPTVDPAVTTAAVSGDLSAAL